MSDDDLERRLRESFAAHARAAVPDDRQPPVEARALRPGRVAHVGAGNRRAGRAARWAPLAAAAVVLALVVGVAVVLRHPGRGAPVGTALGASTSSVLASSAGTAPGTGPSATSTASSAGTGSSSGAESSRTGGTVHVSLAIGTGSPVGVGLPVIASLSQPITDARPFARATSVIVNGKPVAAAWYFMQGPSGAGSMQAHLRLQDYWPAHASIQVRLLVQGLSAGGGLAYQNSPTLEFSTRAAMIATVHDSTHRLSVSRDGEIIATYPVSLGTAATPTTRGTKVIMEKGASICMRGVGYDQCGVKYTQRLTESGEYLHAAPWNTANIGRVDSSNGCTNLLPSDAQALYALLAVGDVVTYPDATGPTMSMTAGFGDWNVSWSEWLKGGALPTH